MSNRVVFIGDHTMPKMMYRIHEARIILLGIVSIFLKKFLTDYLVNTWH
jgi:hypothetical protein